jgi:predicted amidohydrolase
VAAVDPANAAFDALLEELTSSAEVYPPWLDIATRLLVFCHKFAPFPDGWEGLPAFEPWRTILTLEVRVAVDLIAVDRASLERLDSQPVLASFATPNHLRALRDAATRELNPPPFGDSRLSLAVVARALAGAIDNVAGHTYLAWFRSHGQVTITQGKPYPVCRHDPRRWLGGHTASTNPATFPSRDLACTPRLRVATGQPQYKYVIDFRFWDRLSLLGSGNDLALSAAQPNIELAEFAIRVPPKEPHTYINQGPKDAAQQVDRIIRLVDEAMAQDAELIVIPEYAVSESAHSALVTRFGQGSTVPLVFCAGLARGTGADDYMANEAWLLMSTPGIEHGASVHFHAKTCRAKLGDAEERIRTASEVRVFVSQQWSLCALICLEAMASEILHQLALIGTNLLLVPAMSEKTGAMISAISRLCQESQAFVVLANGPASWPGTTTASRCEAYFAGPYGSSPWSWCAPRAGQRRQDSQIAAWVFRAAQRTVSFHPLHPNS